MIKKFRSRHTDAPDANFLVNSLKQGGATDQSQVNQDLGRSA